MGGGHFVRTQSAECNSGHVHVEEALGGPSATQELRELHIRQKWPGTIGEVLLHVFKLNEVMVAEFKLGKVTERLRTHWGGQGGLLHVGSGIVHNGQVRGRAAPNGLVGEIQTLKSYCE